jgi:hypothetical protein
MDQGTWEAIRANLFPGARQAIQPWQDFPWHRGSDGTCQTLKPQSSQALAIDVFGTIAVSPERDLAMAAIARDLGLPAEGPWTVALEWDDRELNRLREKRRSQIDAMAIGKDSLIFFECKFTEADGGRCSQTQPVASGAHRGQRQCSGDYALQTNPVNGVRERCALSGKGIRYWSVIPRVFDLRAESDHRPCPFAGPWFQWMRNLVLCHEVAAGRGLRPAFVVVYADGLGLPIAAKTREGGWADLEAALRPAAVQFRTISFQRVVGLATGASQSASGGESSWDALREWVARKVSAATEKQGQAD